MNDTVFGQCDACECPSFLRRSWYRAMETWACAECSGHDVGEFDPDDEHCEFCGEEMWQMTHIGAQQKTRSRVQLPPLAPGDDEQDI